MTRHERWQTAATFWIPLAIASVIFLAQIFRVEPKPPSGLVDLAGQAVESEEPTLTSSATESACASGFDRLHGPDGSRVFARFSREPCIRHPG